MTISTKLDVKSAKSEITKIIQNYKNQDLQRRDIGILLQMIHRKHGPKQANFIIQELSLEKYNIRFACPVIEYYLSIQAKK